MIDRGFIKWQPFQSLIPNKNTIDIIEKEKNYSKPILFPEKINQLNELILEAYYNKSIIKINYYEAGQLKEIKSFIKKINPNSHTIELGNHQTLHFKQIININ